MDLHEEQRFFGTSTSAGSVSKGQFHWEFPFRISFVSSIWHRKSLGSHLPMQLKMELGCLEVQKTAEKGRGLFATRDLKAGQVVLREQPIMLTVSYERRLDTCATCLRIPNPNDVRKCLACEQACFCSHECERVGRETQGIHDDAVCKALMGANWSEFDPEYQDMLRYLIQICSLRNGAEANNYCQTQLKALSTLASKPVDGMCTRKFQEYLCSSFGSELDLSEIDDFVGKETANSYGIMMPRSCQGRIDNVEEMSLRIRGGGLYLHASLINHECIPNVARCDDFEKSGRDNSLMVFRTLHDLPAGTEVVQSYFPISWDYEDRADQCKTVYGFDCLCPRCKVETNNPPDSLEMSPTYVHLFLLKYVCPCEGCEGILVPCIDTDVYYCSACGFHRTEAEFLEELDLSDDNDVDDV